MAINPTREAIIELHRRGISAQKIIKQLKVLKSTVYDAIQRFEEFGTRADRHRSGRPVTVSTPKMIKRIRSHLDRNPQRLMRKMAKQLDISEFSAQNIVKKKLNVARTRLQLARYFPANQRRTDLTNADS
jgi:transposase